MARKAVPSTAWCHVHGTEAAAWSATRMKAAAVKSSGGTHAARMEATTAGMEAAAARMETATGWMKAGTTTWVKAAPAATMEAATTTHVWSAAATAAAAGSRVGEVSECEARDCARKDCGDHP